MDTATGTKPNLSYDDLKWTRCDVTYIGGVRHGNKLHGNAWWERAALFDEVLDETVKNF